MELKKWKKLRLELSGFCCLYQNGFCCLYQSFNYFLIIETLGILKLYDIQLCITLSKIVMTHVNVRKYFHPSFHYIFNLRAH